MLPSSRGELALAWQPVRRRAALALALLSVLAAGGEVARARSPHAYRPLALPDAPTVLAVSPATRRIYVALWPSDVVYALDGASGRVIGAVPLVGTPSALAVDPATEHVYAAVPNGVAMLSGATMTLLTTVTLGKQPTAIAVDPGYSRAYVATQLVGRRRPHDSVVVLDGLDGAVVAELPVGLGPTGMAVDPLRHRVYVANSGSDAVSVLDGRTGVALAAFPVRRSPWAVAVDPSRRRLYVGVAGDSTLLVLDAATGAVIARIAVGGQPGPIVVSSDDHRAYVAGRHGSLAAVDADKEAVRATFALGAEIRDVAVEPSSGTVYATAFDRGALWAIRDRRFGQPVAAIVAAAAPQPSG